MAESMLDAVRQLHTRSELPASFPPGRYFCTHCHTDWPCPTIQAIAPGPGYEPDWKELYLSATSTPDPPTAHERLAVAWERHHIGEDPNGPEERYDAAMQDARAGVDWMMDHLPELLRAAAETLEPWATNRQTLDAGPVGDVRRDVSWAEAADAARRRIEEPWDLLTPAMKVIHLIRIHGLSHGTVSQVGIRSMDDLHAIGTEAGTGLEHGHRP